MKKIIYLMSAIILLSACKERFDLDPAQTIWIVAVEAKLTNENIVHTAIITGSKRVTDTHIPYIPGATVKLVKNGIDTITYVESDSIPGIYESPYPFRGVPGSTYEMIVSGIDYNYDGVMDVSRAKETMPEVIVIDSIDIERVNYPQIEMVGWYIGCYAWDPPQENYYLFKGWNNGVLVSDTLHEVYITDDELFNGNYTNGIQCVYFDEEKGEYINPGDSITLGIYNTTKSVYNFYSQAKQIIAGTNPVFSGPPANIESNFSGDVKGFFEVYTVSKASTIAPPGIGD